ncbi:hypothetical protein, partial [Escherichia coli]|uniref:hypothetical protein n=1 Tax=Escherichia coli TaxID=562 RepID=UPI0038CC18BC
GIGVLDISTATETRRERVFYCRMHAHTCELWWAVWGHRKVRRLVDPVTPTLHSSPPDDWRRRW